MIYWQHDDDLLITYSYNCSRKKINKKNHLAIGRKKMDIIYGESQKKEKAIGYWNNSGTRIHNSSSSMIKFSFDFNILVNFAFLYRNGFY